MNSSKFLLLKGGKPGAPGLVSKVITDKSGRNVTHWVRQDSEAATHQAAPSADVNADPAEQFMDAEKAYGGKPAWERARAAGKTKLNYHQWVQVRTPSFKEWFGDWEATANINWLDTSAPVASMKGDEVPVFEKLGQLAKWVGDYWVDNHQGKATHERIGDIAIDHVSASKSIAHGLNKTKAQAFYLVPQAIPKARLLGELQHEPNKPMAYVLAAPVAIGDSNYKLLMEVREDQNKRRLYIHEAVLRNDKPVDSFNFAAASSLPKAEPRTEHHGSIFRLVESLRKVKSSKVTDPETGEPMVVYHGTNYPVFTEFETSGAADTKTEGTGAFFSDSQIAAESYTDKSYPSSMPAVMPVFLKIKNPLVVDFECLSWDRC